MISTDTSQRGPQHVIGIGASAGGLDAIEKLLKNFPVDACMAFVLVQHLSPDFKSLMSELLARHTKMHVTTIESGQKIEANCIYLAPPKHLVEFRDDLLWLKEVDGQRSPNHPIDFFFSSLAGAIGERAVAVVLSGTGTDGTKGIAAIRKAGGLVVVQEPRSATFDGMPRSAIATGFVDIICRPEEIPDKLLQVFNASIHDPSRGLQTGQKGLPLVPTGNDLPSLFDYLRKRFGVDFSLYKPATIHRRLARRMEINHCEDLPEYISRVSHIHGEADALYRDLLVEVTRFFRDEQAFETLAREVIPLIVSASTPPHPIRVWVAGCATGEEAYSIVMSIAHECNKQNRSANIRIFATDLHEESLKHAGAGKYSAEAVAHVPEVLRSKYFIQHGELYTICPEIRRMINFAAHDLIEDPPFTRLDLISCRNVMIYLESEAQSRVLSQFHFALKQGGYLFLGPSESLGDFSRGFEMIDHHCRIFRRIGGVDFTRIDSNIGSALRLGTRAANPIAVRAKPTEESQVINLAYDALLDRFVPPSIIITDAFELLHCFGAARDLLQVPTGKATLNVCRLLPPDLASAVNLLVTQQLQSVNEGMLGPIPVTIHGEQRHCELRAFACEKNGRRYMIVTFEFLKHTRTNPTETIDIDAEDSSHWRTHVFELERRLSYTQQSLQSTVEELETSNEELQSTNEELTAANEELQSTNEELQSVNEELYTVNDENKQRIDDLVRMSDDLDNLITNSGIACIFLNEELKITRFSPGVSTIFDLIRDDIGRPLSNFSPKVETPKLLANIRLVIQTGIAVSSEVAGPMGVMYIERIAPYHDSHGSIKGVMIIYTDVSAVLTTRELQERIQRLGIGDQVAVWEWPDTTKDEMWWSPECYSLLGYAVNEFPPQFRYWKGMIHEDDLETVRSFGTADCPIVRFGSIRCRLRHKHGHYVAVMIRAMFGAEGSSGNPRMTGSVAIVGD